MEASINNGFQALVVADNIGETRQIAIRDNGDIYAALMNPIDLGYVVAMRDTNADGIMDVIKYFENWIANVNRLGYMFRLYVGLLLKSSAFHSRSASCSRQDLETVVSGLNTAQPSQQEHYIRRCRLSLRKRGPPGTAARVDRTQARPERILATQLAGCGCFLRISGQKQMEDGSTTPPGFAIT